MRLRGRLAVREARAGWKRLWRPRSGRLATLRVKRAEPWIGSSASARMSSKRLAERRSLHTALAYYAGLTVLSRCVVPPLLSLCKQTWRDAPWCIAPIVAAPHEDRVGPDC